MQTLTILGPNLRDQSKGSFHVHDAQCGHLNRYRDEESYTAGFDSVEDVVNFIYEDIIAENEGDDWTMYENDFHFCPCVKF